MAAYTRTIQPKGVDQIYRILGCEFRAGRCVTHQRPNDQWRPGCPLADHMMHQPPTSHTRRRA